MSTEFSDDEIVAFLDERLEATRRDALRDAIAGDAALARRVAEMSIDARGIGETFVQAQNQSPPDIVSARRSVPGSDENDTRSDDGEITPSDDAEELAFDDEYASAGSMEQRRFDASAVIAAAAASASAVTRAATRTPTWTTPAAPVAHSAAVGEEAPDAQVSTTIEAQATGPNVTSEPIKPSWRQPDVVSSAPPSPSSTPVTYAADESQDDTDHETQDSALSWHVDQPIEPGRFEPSWAAGMPGALPAATNPSESASIRRKAIATIPRPGRKIAASLLLAGAAGLVAGWFVGAMTTGGDESDTAGWQQAVVNYQSLYVRETLPRVAPTEADQIVQLANVATNLGREIPMGFVDLPALEFMRAQTLAVGAKPLVQLLFSSPEGEPVALCFTHTGEPERAPAMTTIGDTNAMTWNRNGYGFILIGNTSADVLRTVSAVAAGRF